MSKKKSAWLSVSLMFLLTVGCAIDFDITDHTLASSTLNFENPEDFDFDPNYVEIK